MEKKCKIIYLNDFIYILSNDEIKEDDWVIHLGNPYFQFKENMRNLLCKECKKIIATTDTSLIIAHGGDFGSRIIPILPQPSQQFIKEYIESYNKGEIITDVLVEYSPSSITLQTYSNQQINDNLKALSLKVNPKDSWNRKEIVVLLNKLNNTLNIGSDLTLEEWINKNL